MRNIDLNLLAVFDTLFDERNVTRAADRLALTQPTVSGMLKRLRHIFSDELFIRTSHGILPTPRADEIAGPIKEILDNVQQLIKPDIFEPTTAVTTIRVCGTDFMQFVVLNPLIMQIRKIAPGIKLSILPRPTEGISEYLARGDIDLYVSTKEMAIHEFPSRLLFKDQYVCVARKNHPLKIKKISLKQLCSYDHVMVAPTGGRLHGPVDDILAGTSYRRHVVAAVPTFQILFEILFSDDYFAFIPKLLVSKLSTQLREFKTEITMPDFEVVANWHPRVDGDPQHKWLLEQLNEVVKRIAG